MVQVVENWSTLSGTVREIRPDPELPDHVVASIDVDRVEPVESGSGEFFPNLLGEAAGGQLDITVQRDAASATGLAPGRRMTGKVQRTSPFRCLADGRDLSVD